MTLAEAHSRLDQLEALISSLRASLTRVSISRVPDVYQKINALLSEYGELRAKCFLAEDKIDIGGMTVSQVKALIQDLEMRIELSKEVQSIGGLPEDAVAASKSNEKRFQSTIDSLNQKLSDIYWEIELLVE